MFAKKNPTALAVGVVRGSAKWRHYGITPKMLHRIASMASGGMDTLPHNRAVITLLAITGLTHRQSYKDIFIITILKTAAVFILAFSASLFI